MVPNQTDKIVCARVKGAVEKGMGTSLFFNKTDFEQHLFNFPSSNFFFTVAFALFH